MTIRLIAAAVLMLAAAGHASADALDAVRDILHGFAGKTPMQAAVERQIVSERSGKTREQGRTTVSASAGAEGLQLAYPADDLARAAAEKQDLDPERARPVSRAITSIDAAELATLFNCAPDLLRDLEGAKLLKVSSAHWHGAPARLLEIELVVRLTRTDSKRVNDASSTLKLWLAEDGMPLASEKLTALKGRIMLIGFEASDFQSRAYVRRADRLVALRDERRTESAGFGESAKDERVTLVQVQ